MSHFSLRSAGSKHFVLHCLVCCCCCCCCCLFVCYCCCFLGGLFLFFGGREEGLVLCCCFFCTGLSLLLLGANFPGGWSLDLTNTVDAWLFSSSACWFVTRPIGGHLHSRFVLFVLYYLFDIIVHLPSVPLRQHYADCWV